MIVQSMSRIERRKGFVCTTLCGAELSDDGVYRYRLTRVWDVALPVVVFLMLNPSTADGFKDDATIRRIVGFARAWGYGGVVVVNLYAFRTAYPTVLVDAAAAVDVVGPENDRVLAEAFASAGLVVAAWGAAEWAQARGRAVMAAHPKVNFHCLRKTKAGCPEHPVRLPKGLSPALFRQEAV